MMWKKVALRFLGTGLFVWSIAVTGMTLATVASVEASKPRCPPCDDYMGCQGSLCTCQQTGMGSGVWACVE